MDSATAGSTVFGPEGGYPGGTATAAEPGTGYPGAKTEVMATDDLAKTVEVISTPTAIPVGGKGIARLVNFSRKNWPYLLAAFGLEIILLAILGFVLYRKGLLTFPLLPKKK